MSSRVSGRVGSSRRRFWIHSSVADLTFLPALWRVLRRNVKSKATLEYHMVASVPLVPTFVRVRAAKGYERRNRDTRALCVQLKSEKRTAFYWLDRKSTR